MNPPAPVPAELDRRFHAFVVDRLVLLVLDGLAVATAWFLLREEGPDAGAATGVLAGLGVALLGRFVLAVVLGLTGSSPGRAATGLRVLGEVTGGPVGVGRALLRSLVLTLAGLPTFGIGLATLAWTAVADPSGRRRGAHDRLAGSVVADVRPPEDAVPDLPPVPRQVVNLTAMRLAPPPVAPPPAVRPAAPAAAAPPARPSAPPPAPAVPAPAMPAVRGWVVTVDTGETVAVTGSVLLGRRPEAGPGEPAARLVRLQSADLSVSKTHAQLLLAPDGALVVRDRGSTNGTLLVRQGATRRLSPDQPATLLAGDRLRVGDRELTVARAELPST